jgi:hypothetical protein
VFSTARYVMTGASMLAGAVFAGPAWADHDGRPVKIMIINMFGGPAPSEASAFTGNLHLNEAIHVRGLSPDYPNILCNSDDVCQMIAGEGHANVAASTIALILSEKFDLRDTLFPDCGHCRHRSPSGDHGLGGVGARSRRLRDFPGDRLPRDSKNGCRSERCPVALWISGDLSHRHHDTAVDCPVCRRLIIARCIN